MAIKSDHGTHFQAATASANSPPLRGTALTFAECARVRAEAGYLLVPVTPEIDAGLEGLNGVAAGATPVDICANVYTARRAFLQQLSALSGLAV